MTYENNKTIKMVHAYEKNDVVRMIQVYGQITSSELYLINELRRPKHLIGIQLVKEEARRTESLWLEIYDNEFPEEIKKELHGMHSLEQLIVQAKEL